LTQDEVCADGDPSCTPNGAHCGFRENPSRALRLQCTDCHKVGDRLFSTRMVPRKAWHSSPTFDPTVKTCSKINCQYVALYHVQSLLRRLKWGSATHRVDYGGCTPIAMLSWYDNGAAACTAAMTIRLATARGMLAIMPTKALSVQQTDISSATPIQADRTIELVTQSTTPHCTQPEPSMWRRGSPLLISVVLYGSYRHGRSDRVINFVTARRVAGRPFSEDSGLAGWAERHVMPACIRSARWFTAR